MRQLYLYLFHGVGWLWGLTGFDRKGRQICRFALRAALRRYTPTNEKTVRRGPRLRQSGGAFRRGFHARLSRALPGIDLGMWGSREGSQNKKDLNFEVIAGRYS